jgi:enoyl-CoA hydratase
VSAEVCFEVQGGFGRIRLDRPRALHALTAAMCEAMIERVVAWRADPSVQAIAIDHAGGRGFCAGGDVRMAAESGAGDGVTARAFFRTEYQLNHLLFTTVKPTIAFMDGVTMGGGVGLALPCRYRIATERTLFAMPETTIGLFPDVGGGWYLSRLPGQMGKYLALTGARLNGADCLRLGLATHYLTSVKVDEAKQWLAERPASEIDAIFDGMSDVPNDEETISARQPDIDRFFAGQTLEEILADLSADKSDWAAEQHASLVAKSPQACKVALRLLREGARMSDFADEMRMEFGVAAHVCQRHDFIEGVRALLVDKDNAPRWDPATPESVTEHMLDTIFAPLPSGTAWEPFRA